MVSKKPAVAIVTSTVKKFCVSVTDDVEFGRGKYNSSCFVPIRKVLRNLVFPRNRTFQSVS